jgi:hypothetical protein
MFGWVLAQSLVIPATFMISIPIALVFGANAGEYTWIVAIPVLVVLRRLTRGRGNGHE